MSTSEYCEIILNEFVNGAGAMRQRDPAWYASMSTTIGGSEVAAVLGRSPYSDYFEVARGKIKLRQGINDFPQNINVWFGTIFENIIGFIVSYNFESPLYGDDICIQKYPCHRNSPDGYIVAKLKPGVRAAGTIQDLYAHSNGDNFDSDIDAPAQILLCEFKCPFKRPPGNEVPEHYVPQLWSGLAVSPRDAVKTALFVDAKFRVSTCATMASFDNKLISISLYGKIKETGTVLGKGIILCKIHDTELRNDIMTQHKVLGEKCIIDGNTYLDVGTMSKSLIEMIFGEMVKKNIEPYFLPFEMRERAVDPLEYDTRVAEPVDDCELAIAWKLFDIRYHLVQEEFDFEKEIYPHVKTCMDLVNEAEKQPNPLAYIDRKEREYHSTID